MEMPDSCYHCKIAESCGHYIANYTNRRHPECPLGALPDTHGRLIDADAIVNAMNDMNVEGELFVTAVEYVKLIMNDADAIVESEDSE